MDRLYTPWRYAFITASGQEASREECVFCAKVGMGDEQALVIHRGRAAYVCLNQFPYNNGHVMVIPNAHVDSLTALSREVLDEVAELTQLTERVLRETYAPDGLNIGINLGKAAGAGVAGHLHVHALPRWTGDANFMSVVGETRVLPEELTTTWQRLRKGFAAVAGTKKP